PEQAKGRPVDRRTDIWAFGCVLYEMLTGRWVFESRDSNATVTGAHRVQDILAKILQAEPDWTALPEATPPAIQSLLRYCLQKNVKRRWHNAADIYIQIEETLSTPATAAPPAARLLWRRALPPVLAGLVVAAVVADMAIRNRTVPAIQPVS